MPSSPFIHPLNKYLLSTHTVPRSVPFRDAGSTGRQMEKGRGLGLPLRDLPLVPGITLDKTLLSVHPFMSIKCPAYFIPENNGCVRAQREMNSAQGMQKGLRSGQDPDPLGEVGLHGVGRSKKDSHGQNKGEAMCTMVKDVGVRELARVSSNLGSATL